MKKRNILYMGLLLVGLSSCNDFLDVNSDSKYDDEYIFSDYDEMNRALNGVYQGMLNNNTYGDKFLNTYALNNDVEFTPNGNMMQSASGNEYKSFDCTRNGGDLNSTWSAAYSCIEKANTFINGALNSNLLTDKDTIVIQRIGEAKVIRAMNYFDMVVLFGDIPFSFTRSYDKEDLVMPVVDRYTILTNLIDDLKDIAPHMRFAKDMTDGVERVSKEFCWSMIARIAMTRAGYSLNPDKANPSSIGTMKRADDYMDYYKIAMNYCDSVISSGTHSLSLPYRQVFIDECNYKVNSSDDPIFEIPFTKMTSGNIGYIHGPQNKTTDDVTTGKNVWGASNGGMRLNAFYRYSFDEKDLRRDFVNGFWYYEADGTPTILTDYTMFCNKWSKLWATEGNSLGVTSSGNTGINYPYMRYTDVLLMYAEAVNEVENGVSGVNGQKAINALKEVRNRAFDSEDRAEKVDAYITAASASKETFFDAIANERKWEFAGENMRWKDLVRWNKYSEVVYDTFMKYFGVACAVGGDYEYDPEGFADNLPVQMFYKVVPNPGNSAVYPNTTLDVLEIYNPYILKLNPGEDWQLSEQYGWYDDSNSAANAKCRYSFRGYISADEFGTITPMLDRNNLPPVRYILPYPNAAIQRSAGAYKNYYGYN